MEFQTLDAVEEDDDLSRTYRNDGGRGKSVYEKYRASPPKVYEGCFGKMQRIVSSNAALSHLPQVLTVCRVDEPDPAAQRETHRQ